MKRISPVTRLKALADPTRLRLLLLLEEEELTVGELTDILGMTQSRVSGHLAVLREADLVRDRRQGTSSHYSPVRQGEARETWDALRGTLPDLEEAAGDLRRLEDLRSRRLEKSREFFDRAARSWDDGRSESLGYFAGVFCLAGLLPRRLTVLDMGTGTGSLLPLLAGQVERVVAVDSSRGMLRQAAGRVRESGIDNVSFQRGDLERLPLGDATVDGVVANMVLHHLPSPERTLREVARVLKPGGRGVVVDFESHEESWLLEDEGHRWAGFDPAQIGGWCVDAGLSVPGFTRVPTPDSGRWSRLEVFVAQFGRRGPGERRP